MRRLVHFYTRYSMPLHALVLQEAYQHPDYEHLADEFYADDKHLSGSTGG